MPADRFLRNAWYACGWADEVGRNLLARTMLEEPIVVFRRADGTPVALEDRCCHRHLPLSKGRLIGDTLQCGYHGLEFDAAGNCTRVPGQARVPPDARVRSYPAVEKHRLVWLWMGDPAKPDPDLIPDMHWNDSPGWAFVGVTVHVDCDYRLMVDNILDLTHETFIHANSLGNQAVVEHPIKTARDGDKVTVTRWMCDHEPAPFWKKAIGREVNCDRWQIIECRPPAYLVLDVGVAPSGTGAPAGDRSRAVGARNCHAITPETGRSVWQFVSFARDFRIDDAELSRNLREALYGIQLEDKRFLEAQQRSLETAPPEYKWIDVNADAGTIQARRALDAALAREASEGGRQAAE
jgi:vanillate O-demethylase monooxygenase subunit